MNALYNKNIIAAADQIKQGRFDLAIATLKWLFEEFGDDELLLGMLAGSYFQIGLLDRARDHYKRILIINPLNHLAALQLGLCHRAMGNMAMALAAWEPLIADPRDFLGHFHAGLTLLELGRLEDASEVLAICKHNMPIDYPYRVKLNEITANIVEMLS